MPLSTCCKVQQQRQQSFPEILLSKRYLSIVSSSFPLKHQRQQSIRFSSTESSKSTQNSKAKSYISIEEWNLQTQKLLEDSKSQLGFQRLVQNPTDNQQNDNVTPTIESLLDSLVYLHDHYQQQERSTSSLSSSDFYSNLDSALAWKLLDLALVFEQTIRTTADGTSIDYDDWTMKTDPNTSKHCLNIVLQLWRAQYNTTQDNNSGSHRKKRKADNPKNLNLLTPSQVLTKLDDYRSSMALTMISPPDVRSYNILMEAASSSEVIFCTRLWDWMWEESTNDPMVRPDLITLRTLMKIWVQSGHPDAAEHCEDLVDEWIQRTAITSNDNNEAALSSSNGIRKSLIHVWALKDPMQAEAYLKDMIHRASNSSSSSGGQNNMEDDTPDTIAWNRVISAYAITHGRPEDAARLLGEFWAYSKKNKNNTIRPDPFSYSSVIEGWARVGNVAEANRTMKELQRLSMIHPNIVSYTSAMKANVAADDVRMVEQLANECLQAYDEEQKDREQRSKVASGGNPSFFSFGSELSATEDESLFDDVMSEHQQQEERRQEQYLVLDTAFFNTWLTVYSYDRNDNSGATDQALAVLNHMKQRKVPPDTVTYLTLFQCFLVADENQWAQEWLLEHAKEINDEAALVSFVSRLVTWNSSKGIDSMSLLQELYEKDHFKDITSWDRLISNLLANQGKAVLQWMKSPTTKSYSLVLRALANDSDGQAAESLFRKWQDKQQQDENDDLEDSLLVDMYTSVIVGWSKSGNSERTLSWYNEWASANNSSTAVLPPPTQIVQTAVLSSLARARDPQGAENFLRRLVEDYRLGRLDAPPDLVMYNIVLSSWARAKGKNAKRAERLLNAMDDKDTISYNTTIYAYAKMGKMKRAEELTSDLVDLYRSTNNDSCCPDLATFRTLLSGYVRSKDPKASERAVRLWGWMQSLYKEEILKEPPDEKCYDMIQSIVAKSKGKGRSET